MAKTIKQREDEIWQEYENKVSEARRNLNDAMKKCDEAEEAFYEISEPAIIERDQKLEALFKPKKK